MFLTRDYQAFRSDGLRAQVDLSVQRWRDAVAVLLEAQIDGAQREVGVRETPTAADGVARFTFEPHEAARRRSGARRRVPEVRRGREDRSGGHIRVARVPVDLPVQRWRGALAVHLETEIEGGQRGGHVG